MLHFLIIQHKYIELIIINILFRFCKSYRVLHCFMDKEKKFVTWSSGHDPKFHDSP